jgi:short-subunit dehydrogenase
MTFFITGVGSGIGMETAIYAVSQGHHVVGTLRKTSQAEKLLSRVSNSAGKLDILYIDLLNKGFERDILNGLESLRVKSIHCVINIAGTLDITPLKEFEYHVMEKVMQINLYAPAMIISVLQPYLKGVENANIINITSMSGFQGSVRFPGLAIYGASKAALASLSESLSVELEKDGIHINALAIGSVNTEMLQTAFPDFQASINPKEMGEYIFSFAINGSRFFNGKTIPVAITNP